MYGERWFLFFLSFFFLIYLLTIHWRDFDQLALLIVYYIYSSNYFIVVSWDIMNKRQEGTRESFVKFLDYVSFQLVWSVSKYFCTTSWVQGLDIESLCFGRLGVVFQFCVELLVEVENSLLPFGLFGIRPTSLNKTIYIYIYINIQS